MLQNVLGPGVVGLHHCLLGFGAGSILGGFYASRRYLG